MNIYFNRRFNIMFCRIYVYLKKKRTPNNNLSHKFKILLKLKASLKSLIRLFHKWKINSYFFYGPHHT